MGFIGNDERIIVMDINRASYFDGAPDYQLTTDDMKRLRDAGCHTVLQQMWWGEIQEKGRCRWAAVDRGVERAQKAGMKVLLQCYQTAPDDLPEDWYARYEDGTLLSHLSIWNDKATAYEEKFVRKLVSRYGGPDVLVKNSLISDGETLLGYQPEAHAATWYDPAGLASYKQACGETVTVDLARTSGWLRNSLVKKMVQYQGLLLETQEHNEIWLSMHPHIFVRSTGAEYAADVLRGLRAAYADTTIFWLLYTFYELTPDWCNTQIGIAQRNGIQMVVGGQHCQGLDRTAPAAKRDGLRLICGPRHDNIMPDQTMIEDWMVEKLTWAVQEMS